MKIQSPFLVRLAGLLFASGLWLLFRTLWLDRETTDANPYASDGPDRFLFSVWHDSSVIAAFGGKHKRTVALTSRHRDGSFVEAVAHVAGVTAVRGSTGATGGARALRELIRVAREHDIVITPDGPRGPRRTISRGIVFLASRTGNAIVPTAFACARGWQIPGSWTTLVVPAPFSRVILLAGDPIHVPPQLRAEAIDQYVAEVQLAMDQLDAKALELAKDGSSTPRDT